MLRLQPSLACGSLIAARLAGGARRDVAWNLFVAINATTRVADAGFASVGDVSRSPPALQDRQQSFFLAETLKYFLLLFSDDSLLDLGTWVLNTEAHPVRRMSAARWRELAGGSADWLPADVRATLGAAAAQG